MAQVNYISAEKLGELLRTADPHGRITYSACANAVTGRVR